MKDDNAIKKDNSNTKKIQRRLFTNLIVIISFLFFLFLNRNAIINFFHSTNIYSSIDSSINNNSSDDDTNKGVVNEKNDEKDYPLIRYDKNGYPFSKNEFDILIDDELYILLKYGKDIKPYTSIKDIKLEDVFTLIFNKLEYNYNDSIGILSSSVYDMYMNSTCFSNLYNYFDMNFDNYIYNSSSKAYFKNKDIESTRMLYYPKVVAKRLSNYRYENGLYKIDVNYLFANNEFVGDKGIYGYGSLNDLFDSSKKIVVLSQSFDGKSYLKNNYNKIKDKLDTYHYSVEVLKSGRVYLSGFSIN